MNDEVPGYRILQQVGEGGFSLVYRARQERLDRIVALKVLSVNAVDDATLRRFQRECQITGRLTGHPNVVTVLDTGMTKAGRPYIAMDFFEHGSLRDRLTREGPFPVSDILRIGVKICGALAATHQAEVLHRDVKPQNILVSRYGEPALADFGVARLVDTFEATHTNAFTPHHAAPEVVNGRPPGVSSDIYSLGSTLYQLLAGAPAFKGTTDTGIGPLMLRIINEPPPAINRPDLPPRVFEAIQISMAKEPADRFKTAVDFAARLQQLQSELGLPVTELAGSGALTGPPYIPGSGGPQGPTGPSSGFPGLDGAFPGPGEYVGFPAPGEGVTADPLEHSAFKQLNPGLYPAPQPDVSAHPIPLGTAPPASLDDAPAAHLDAPSPTDSVDAPPAPQGVSPTPLGAPSPTDFVGAPPAQGATPSAHAEGAAPPTQFENPPPASSDDATYVPSGDPSRSRPDDAPRTDAEGGPPARIDDASRTTFDGAARAQPNGAPPARFDGAPPTHLDGAGRHDGLPPAPPNGAPAGPFAGGAPAWGPVAEGGPWLRQQPPTQQAMSSSPPPTMQHHLAPSPRESTPRTLPPTQDVPPPSETDERTASGGMLLGVLVTVLVILGLGIGGVVLLGGGKPAPKPAPTTPAAQPLASAPPVAPATMNAVRPHGLKVHDAGTLVTLSWQLGKKGKTVPLLIQQSQADQTGKSLPLTVANGTTSAPIASLDPTAGYCFEVGAIAAFSTKPGQPAAVAWSTPTCIRGAQPQH